MKEAGRRGRPRSDSTMVPTAVVLPRDLLERLRNDAQQTGRGLSTEIRQRLMLTCGTAPGPRDPETSELIELIQLLADSLARDQGKWHESEASKAAFAAGLLELIGAEPVDRSRSFAERYVLERASTFTPGNERQEGWRATLDAQSIYKMIVQTAREPDRSKRMPDPGSAQADQQPIVRDIADHGDDPETVGRTHARLVRAARREAREPEQEQPE
jgi:hypothetical protein